MANVNVFLLLIKLINIIPDKFFTRDFSVVSSSMEHGHFWHIDISQGSVAAQLRFGGKLKYEFVANLPLSLLMKEFWKHFGSYGQKFNVLFF